MKNIILIGFMASGKTVVGQLLAEQINYNFVDIDQKIEECLEMPTIKIMNTYPLAQINLLAQEMVNKLYILKQQLLAISLNSLNDENIVRMLKHNGHFIFLQSNLEHVLRNTVEEEKRTGKQRLILNGYEKVGHFAKCKKYSQALRLLIDANLLFESIADYTIDVNNKSIDLIVSSLKTYLSKNYLIN